MVDLPMQMSFNDIKPIFLKNIEIYEELQIRKGLLELDQVTDIIFHVFLFGKVVHHFGGKLFFVLADTFLKNVVLVDKSMGGMEGYVGGFFATFAGFLLGLLCGNL